MSEEPKNAYRELLEQALEKARFKNDVNEESKILLDLGFWYEEAADYDQAAGYFESGLQHLKKSPQFVSGLPAMFHLAHIYQMKKKNEKAFSLYSEIAELGERAWDKPSQGLALAYKGDILMREGSQENGWEFLFRGFQILEEAKLKEKLEVKEIIQRYQRKVSRSTFELVLSRSKVSPQVKDLLRKISPC